MTKVLLDSRPITSPDERWHLWFTGWKRSQDNLLLVGQILATRPCSRDDYRYVYGDTWTQEQITLAHSLPGGTTLIRGPHDVMDISIRKEQEFLTESFLCSASQEEISSKEERIISAGVALVRGKIKRIEELIKEGDDERNR